jgi:hypothetical protein
VNHKLDSLGIKDILARVALEQSIGRGRSQAGNEGNETGYLGELHFERKIGDLKTV